MVPSERVRSYIWIHCPTCRRHRPLASKGLCGTCYQRKRKGMDLSVTIPPRRISKADHMAARPEHQRRILIYQERAQAGLPLFQPRIAANEQD